MSTHEQSQNANHNEQPNPENEFNEVMRSSIKEQLQDTPCFVEHSSSKEENSNTLILSLQDKQVSEVIASDGIANLETQKKNLNKTYSFNKIPSIQITNESPKNQIEVNRLTEIIALKEPTSSIMELKDHKTNKKEIETNQTQKKLLAKLQEKDVDNNDQNFEPEVIKLTQNRFNYLAKIKPQKEIVLHPTKLQITEILRRNVSKKRPSEEIEQGYEFNGLSRITIGQEKCSFLATDKLKTISSKHASLHQDENDHWFITDEGSINGTYIIKKRIKLHVGMKLIVGSFIMRILSLETYFKKVNTLWKNCFDTLIPDFELTFQLSRDSPTCVGKDYQEQLKEDIQINQLHFKLHLLRNSEDDDEVILENEDNVFNQVGEQITPYLPFILPKDQATLRLGLLKIFHVKILVELPSVKKCYLCSKPLQSYLILSPCNDAVLSCFDCLLKTIDHKCPSCKLPFVDFSTLK